MSHSLSKSLTFAEFLCFLAEQPESIHYELHDGNIIQMPQPSGKYEGIVMLLLGILALECNRIKLRYGIPKTVLM